MFSLSFDAMKPPNDAVINASNVELGDDWIRKVDIQHVKLEAQQRGGKLFVWIGEVPDPLGIGSGDFDSYSRFQGGEGVKLVIDWEKRPSHVDIVRTADGSTPLHIASEGGRIRASWDFEEIAFSQSSCEPDIEACKFYLEYGPTLSRQQVLRGIINLWPGERYSSDGQASTVREQRWRQVAAPSFLASGSRATDEFLRLIGEVVTLNMNRSKGVLLELSGGLDSSCTAVAAGLLGIPLSSYGLIHNGAIGAQQRVRRRELLEVISAEDHEHPSDSVGPIAALQYPECLFTPMDDNHRFTSAQAIDSHPRRESLDLVITGIGGDELSMERTHARHDFEVPGTIAASAVLASVGRGDIFLRRGIWPSNPLATNRVVDFCRRLPSSLRAERQLHILTLARAGLSDGFLFPRYGENFAAVIIKEAAVTDFDAEVGESILADYGINIFNVLAEARVQAGQDFTSGLAIKLWYLVKLERILKKYVRSC
jgi:hypothetical protein